MLKLLELSFVSPELVLRWLARTLPSMGCILWLLWLLSRTFLNGASLRQHQIATSGTPCSRHVTRHMLQSGWTRIGPAAEPSSAFPISFPIRPAKRPSDPMIFHPRIDTLICQVDTKLVLLMKQPPRSPHPLPPSFSRARSTLATDRGRAGEAAHLPKARMCCLYTIGKLRHDGQVETAWAGGAMDKHIR